MRREWGQGEESWPEVSKSPRPGVTGAIAPGGGLTQVLPSWLHTPSGDRGGGGGGGP